MSDEPAMHDKALNSRSFAKRGELYGASNGSPLSYAVLRLSK